MRKTRLENWIQEIEGLPQLTREALDALQLGRLNETLKRLHDSGRAYPESVGSLKELEALPFTTAQMLADKPGAYLLSSQSEVSRVISGATSGTTGPAKRVFYSEKDTEHTVGFFAAGISEMLSTGEKCLIAFPFSGPFGLGDLIAKAVERLGAIPVKAGFGQSWAELCALVNKTQPDTYIGFPAVLLGLCRVYGDSFPIKRALVSGDACPDGLMRYEHFGGGGAESPYCSFHASYRIRPDGSIQPLPKRKNTGCCCVKSSEARDFVSQQWSGKAACCDGDEATSSLDEFLQELIESTFTVSGMVFQDAHNLDLERLRRCYICEVDSKKGMVPFCAYNLTDVNGRALYRK